jgi:hypothetical protein
MRKNTKLIFIFVTAVMIIGIGVYYISRPNVKPSDDVYGTDRNSSAELQECERKTGKKCIYDLCQVEYGAVPENYKCTSGWKPNY